jgi:hypothetical protein
MPRQLRYIAQPFRDGRPSAPYRFLCAVDAEAGGEILARSTDGVLVFQQWTDAEAAIFEEPEILAVFGEVPSAALMIDGDGRDPWLDDAA